MDLLSWRILHLGRWPFIISSSHLTFGAALAYACEKHFVTPKLLLLMMMMIMMIKMDNNIDWCYSQFS